MTDAEHACKRVMMGPEGPLRVFYPTNPGISTTPGPEISPVFDRRDPKDRPFLADVDGVAMSSADHHFRKSLGARRAVVMTWRNASAHANARPTPPGGICTRVPISR